MSACIIFRTTGNTMQISGFIGIFELRDDAGIVAICPPRDTLGQKDENCLRPGEESCLDLYFSITESAEATYELVMEEYNKRQEMTTIKIEVIE